MPDYAVTCYTCATLIWEGDEAPIDGQTVATHHADTHCARPDCPHTTTAIETARRNTPATVGELEELKAQLAAMMRGTAP